VSHQREVPERGLGNPLSHGGEKAPLEQYVEGARGSAPARPQLMSQRKCRLRGTRGQSVPAVVYPKAGVHIHSCPTGASFALKMRSAITPSASTSSSIVPVAQMGAKSRRV
jgi:hypothetical protein